MAAIKHGVKEIVVVLELPVDLRLAIKQNGEERNRKPVRVVGWIQGHPICKGRLRLGSEIRVAIRRIINGAARRMADHKTKTSEEVWKLNLKTAWVRGKARYKIFSRKARLNQKVWDSACKVRSHNSTKICRISTKVNDKVWAEHVVEDQSEEINNGSKTLNRSKIN